MMPAGFMPKTQAFFKSIQTLSEHGNYSPWKLFINEKGVTMKTICNSDASYSAVKWFGINVY